MRSLTQIVESPLATLAAVLKLAENGVVYRTRYESASETMGVMTGRKEIQENRSTKLRTVLGTKVQREIVEKET